MSGKVKSIKSLLSTLLRDGPCPEREIWHEVERAGFSFRSYHRARKALRIQTERYGWGENGHWEISLPGRSARRLAAIQADVNKQSA